jgi:NADH-quinone oxidoreductase subunit C
MPLALQSIVAELGSAALEIGEGRDMPVIAIEAGRLLDVVTRLKRSLAFDLFADVTAVDWLPQRPRFEVVWHFYSTAHFGRVRVKARVDGDEPVVDSLVGLYGSARFMERECRDMYGIRFRGHPDPRPILLYEGFVGHPLRKDYPKEREQPLVRYRSEP